LSAALLVRTSVVRAGDGRDETASPSKKIFGQILLDLGEIWVSRNPASPKTFDLLRLIVRTYFIKDSGISKMEETAYINFNSNQHEIYTL